MPIAHTKQSRRGAVAPMAALLLSVLVGMLAFAIAVVKGELQNAADAAALAGAARLQNPFVQYYSPGATSLKQIYNGVMDTSAPASAVSTAQRFASANVAGGVNVNVPAADVTFSF